MQIDSAKVVSLLDVLEQDINKYKWEKRYWTDTNESEIVEYTTGFMQDNTKLQGLKFDFSVIQSINWLGVKNTYKVHITNAMPDFSKPFGKDFEKTQTYTISSNEMTPQITKRLINFQKKIDKFLQIQSEILACKKNSVVENAIDKFTKTLMTCVN